MTVFTFANNVNTTLAAGVSAAATTITLSSSSGLPSFIPSGEVLALTLNDAATRKVFEVVYVTAISGATLTVTRAQEGTGAVAWSINDYAFSGPTAGQMASLLPTTVASSTYLPLTGGTLTGSLSIDTGSLVVTTPGSGSGGLILTQHNGSDTSGNARWGGEFTSAIGGASVSSINLYVNELVGNTTRADLQINFAGGSGRSDFYFDQSGSITGPSGAFALQSALTSEANTRASADATKVSKSGDTMTGSLTISGASLYCGYGAGWGGGTATGALRWTNGAIWWGNPANSSSAVFTGLLQVTDVIGNASADKSGLNFGGYDYAGNRYDWYFSWNGSITTPSGKLAFKSDLSAYQPAGSYQASGNYPICTSSGKLIQTFIFTGNNNTTISFPQAFSGIPNSVILTVYGNSDADHYSQDWSSSGFFLGIFGGATNVQFSCVAIGPA